MEGSSGVSVITFEGQEPLTIESELVPFVKQINGHLSLKEIFVFLNEKGRFFSLEKGIELLRFFANQNFLNNPDDFFKILKGDPSKSGHRPKAETLDKSYFSNERLVGLVQKTTLVLKCDRTTAESLLKQATLKMTNPGDKLITQGSKSPYFYVLLTGEMGVYRANECLATLGTLTIFGESAAVFNQVRNADVICEEASWVLEVDASKLVDTKSLKTFEAFKGLKSRLILNQTLAANPLFKKLPTDVLQLFISKCRLEKYSKEQTILEQGEVSGDFYFILKGSVAIIKDGMPVTSLAEGNHFGEVAALFNEPRTAKVITETTATFLVLSQKSLFEVISSHFRLGIDIERTAKARKKSKSNLLQIFEDGEDSQLDTDVVQLDEFTQSLIHSNEDSFLEASQTNFELQLVDFSNAELED